MKTSTGFMILSAGAVAGVAFAFIKAARERSIEYDPLLTPAPFRSPALSTKPVQQTPDVFPVVSNPVSQPEPDPVVQSPFTSSSSINIINQILDRSRSTTSTIATPVTVPTTIPLPSTESVLPDLSYATKGDRLYMSGLGRIKSLII